MIARAPLRERSLVPRDDKLEVRWTNPLEEVAYLDRVRLIAIDHPQELEVHPNERMVNKASSRPPSRFYVLRDSRPIASATSHRGLDATDALGREDRAYYEEFENRPRNAISQHKSLTLDLGPAPGRALLLHG